MDPPRILIVDDSELVLDVMRDVLSQSGFDADAVGTATGALEVLTTRGYAGILKDALAVLGVSLP